MIGNKYIETGYRIGYDTNYKAFMSLFELHNETGNVWSHLLGALLFVWFTGYVLTYMSPP
jgi:adiponectin receptor